MRRLPNRGLRGHIFVGVLLASITVFATPAAGAENDLRLKQCLSETGSDGTCVDGSLLSRNRSTAISPDGRHAYVTDFGDFPSAGRLQVFDRDPDTGRLSSRSGADSCFSQTPDDGCIGVRWLPDAFDVQISPDGEHVYVSVFEGSGSDGDGVAIFDRDPVSGRLTQKSGTAGCINKGGKAGCASSRTMGQAARIYPSPDWRFLYVVGVDGVRSITLLDVASDGSLSQRADADGCITPDGSSSCRHISWLGTMLQIGFAADGKSAYVLSETDSAMLTLLDRDPATGVLTRRSCISRTGFPVGGMNICEVESRLATGYATVVSPDSRYVYALGNARIVTFARAANGALSFAGCLSYVDLAGCQRIEYVGEAHTAAFSPDARLLAIGNYDGLDLLRVDPSSGALTQPALPASCFAYAKSGCTTSPVYGPGDVTFGGDVHLYVNSDPTDTLAVFEMDRAPVCQSATFAVAHATPSPLQLNCSDRNGDAMTLSIVRSPVFGNLGGVSDGQQVVFQPFNRTDAFQDSFTYKATAAGLDSAPATVTLDVAAKRDPRFATDLVAEWLVLRRHTRAKRIRVTGLAPQTTVTVTCKGKRKGCRYRKRQQTFPEATASQDITRWFNIKRGRRMVITKLRPGARVTFTFSAPGVIGKRVSYRIRKRKQPVATYGCTAPGATKPAACPA